MGGGLIGLSQDHLSCLGSVASYLQEARKGRDGEKKMMQRGVEGVKSSRCLSEAKVCLLKRNARAMASEICHVSHLHQLNICSSC